MRVSRDWDGDAMPLSRSTCGTVAPSRFAADECVGRSNRSYVRSVRHPGAKKSIPHRPFEEGRAPALDDSDGRRTAAAVDVRPCRVTSRWTAGTTGC